MFLEAAQALYLALSAAKALAEVTEPKLVDYTLLAADVQSTKGGDTIPERPCIMVTTTISQPALRLPPRTNQGDVLSTNSTRLAIVIQSRANRADEDEAEVVEGYEAGHRAAVNFVRNFILADSSIDIPEEYADDGYEDGVPDLCWDFRPDDGRFEGSTIQDVEGFQHIFFVRISKGEVLWPQ